MQTKQLYSSILIFILAILTCNFSSYAQCPPLVHVGIDSVTTTESRCQATGTATVYASQGAAPYTYSIISGPVTAPAQSANTFQSLSAGSYTAQITDNCNQSVTVNFTISGNYAVPSPTTTLQSPKCQNGNDGSITINVANGRGPFSYSLISPSPVTAGPQASNIFSGLPAGNYTYRVTDSCGNFQTRTVTLPGGSNGDFYIGVPTYKWLACDSYRIAVIIFPNPSQKIPYTLTLKRANGDSVRHFLDSSALGGPGYTGFILDTFYMHIPATETFSLTATNACGITHTTPLKIYQSPYMFNFALDACNGYKYGNYGTNLASLCPTATYTLKDPSGNILSTALASTFPTYSGYPPGSGYKLIINDCCFTDSVTFTWLAAPSLQIQGIQIDKSCKLNNAALTVQFGNVSSPIDLIFMSGPASTTFSDGTVKYYNYPDTLHKYVQGTNYPYALDRISYLAQGTYTIRAIDTCGHIIDTSFTVNASDLRQAGFSTVTRKSCTNAEIIYMGTDNYPNWSNPIAYVTINQSSGNTDPYYYQYYFKVINGAAYPATSTSFTDSMINLPSGTYYVHYHTSTNLIYNGTLQPWLPDDNSHYGGVDTLNGIGFQTCDMLTDTITISGYTNPYFTTPAALAVCNTNRNVAILPDTTSGIQPYQYQITAGPATTALQSSPVFPNLAPGTYTFQMSDACGNSYSNSISVDTLIMPGIATTGSTCQGGTATFTAPANPYYSYKWVRPNGTTDTANAITVSNISNADTGIYKITVTSTINGCSDSTTRNLRLAFCTSLPLHLLNFTAQSSNNCSVILNWETAQEKELSRFDIEYSDDGKKFITIGNVPGQQKTTGGIYTYNYSQPSENGYYRLKITSTDGTSTYSNVVQVNCSKQQTLHIYPNPAGNILHIKCPATTDNTNSSYYITDLSGRIVTNGELRTATDNIINLENLTAGLYLIHVQSQGYVTIEKLVKK
ncbi:T9SS type A sorting domain-containing protein [Chitinophagaceae bacterium MMS25-I14]